jgi:hypothetical protein
MNDSKVLPFSGDEIYKKQKLKNEDIEESGINLNNVSEKEENYKNTEGFNIPELFWSTLTFLTESSDRKERYVKVRYINIYMIYYINF